MELVRIVDDIVPSWHRRAKCWEVNPEAFFPQHTKIKEKVEYAKSICAQCPVIKQCMFDVLDYEREHGDLIGGIYAGMLLEERKEWRLCRRKECSTVIGAHYGNDVYCTHKCKELHYAKTQSRAEEPQEYPYQGRIHSY